MSTPSTANLTDLDLSTVTFASYDAGPCIYCYEPIVENSEDCEGSHGDLAAEFELSDAYDYLKHRIQEAVNALRREDTRAWEFSARNVGWTHSSSDGLINEEYLEADELLNMLVHNRRIDDYRIDVDTSSTEHLSVELLHHDAPWSPERFTFTPVAISDED